MQPWRPEEGAMTFDEVSMERSKSFVMSLQELKNLRPQLYSAAEYCEKSYLHNEQKQLVLDNLKDYAVRALVNAVDHLGTVESKLSDLFEQQAADISTVELKISCISQQILTCHVYTNKEGLKQQQMLVTTTRHHKHYTLPNSIGKRMEIGSKLQNDRDLVHLHAKHDPHMTGVSGTKSLFWHLASDAKSVLRNTTEATLGTGDFKGSKVTPDIFYLLEADTAPGPLSSHMNTSSENSNFDFFTRPSVGKMPSGAREIAEFSIPTSALKPIENTKRLDVYRPPHRSKNMLSTFFAKNKAFLQNRVPVL